MARKQTKADLILMEAQGRVRMAEDAVEGAASALRVAQATREAHRDAYQALDKALAPKPRKVKPATAKQKSLPETKPAT